MSDDRFETIEVKLAFQEEVITQLDDALAHQQKQILELQQQIKLLGNELRNRHNEQDGGADQPEPPPPHY